MHESNPPQGVSSLFFLTSLWTAPETPWVSNGIMAFFAHGDSLGG